MLPDRVLPARAVHSRRRGACRRLPASSITSTSSHPRHLAADWDNVGLLLGERGTAVERIMTCLTVTPDSAAEAVEDGAQLIVTHHPILFRAVQRLTDATPEGRMLLALARAGVAVYSPHTAFDNARDGINDLLAGRTGLRDVRPLRMQMGPRQCKVVVFVPDKACTASPTPSSRQERASSVSTASAAFAWQAPGRSSAARKPIRRSARRAAGRKSGSGGAPKWFVPRHACRPPSLRSANRTPTKSRRSTSTRFTPLRGRVRAHRDAFGAAALGRVRQGIQHALSAGGMQMVGDADRQVQRVAIVCGAGGEFLGDAVRDRADLLVTGEVRFHDCLEARAEGLALLLPGHSAAERCGVEMLAERLQEQWPALRISASRREADPSGGSVDTRDRGATRLTAGSVSDGFLLGSISVADASGSFSISVADASDSSPPGSCGAGPCHSRYASAVRSGRLHRLGEVDLALHQAAFGQRPPHQVDCFVDEVHLCQDQLTGTGSAESVFHGPHCTGNLLDLAHSSRPSLHRATEQRMISPSLRPRLQLGSS